MKEDKTLVCRECGTEFVFSASEQEFYEEKASQMNPAVALVAVKLANNVWASTTSARLAKCSMLLAQNAVKTPKYVPSFHGSSGILPRMLQCSQRLIINEVKKPIA